MRTNTISGGEYPFRWMLFERLALWDNGDVSIDYVFNLAERNLFDIVDKSWHVPGNGGCIFSFSIEDMWEGVRDPCKSDEEHADRFFEDMWDSYIISGKPMKYESGLSSVFQKTRTEKTEPNSCLKTPKTEPVRFFIKTEPNYRRAEA